MSAKQSFTEAHEQTAIARKRILALEGKVRKQIEQDIDARLSAATRPSTVQEETDEELATRRLAAERKASKWKADAQGPSRVFGLFSNCLRDVMDHIEALDDEAVRSSLMADLGFLLVASNKAGALAGEQAIENREKGSAVARLWNSSKPQAKLDKLYYDIEPILREKDQNKTGEQIFKKLCKKEPGKYKKSKRRTVVRHIEDLLKRLAINAVLGNKVKHAELYADMAPILLQSDRNKTSKVVFDQLHQMNAAKYPETKRATTVRNISDILDTQKESVDVWADSHAKVKAQVDALGTLGNLRQKLTAKEAREREVALQRGLVHIWIPNKGHGWVTRSVADRMAAEYPWYPPDQE
jgi:hypothetical protein